jgi:hypothetical protein
MKIGSVRLIGDFNNKDHVRCGQCVLLDDDLKRSQMVNVSMYMLHEVTSCATLNTLNIITEEIIIRLKIQVNATIYMNKLTN